MAATQGAGPVSERERGERGRGRCGLLAGSVCWLGQPAGPCEAKEERGATPAACWAGLREVGRERAGSHGEKQVGRVGTNGSKPTWLLGCAGEIGRGEVFHFPISTPISNINQITFEYGLKYTFQFK